METDVVRFGLLVSFSAPDDGPYPAHDDGSQDQLEDPTRDCATVTAARVVVGRNKRTHSRQKDIQH